MIDKRSQSLRNQRRNSKNIRIILKKKNWIQEKYKCYGSILKPDRLKEEENNKCFIKVQKAKTQKNCRSISIVPLITSKKLYYIAKGNNHSLVSSILELDDYQVTNRPENAELVWLQDNKKYEYSYRNGSLVNMFQFHQQLTDKDKLYNNLSNLCGIRGLDIGEIIPVSFVLDFQSPHIKNMMIQFLSYFILHHPNKNIKSKLKGNFEVSQINFNLKIKYKDLLTKVNQDVRSKTLQSDHRPCQKTQNTDYNQQQNINNKYKTKASEEDKYVWILKPANLNRGRFIKLFSKLKTLEQLLSQNDILVAFKMYADPHRQSRTRYIIQKYIQKPLLINNRKFDIRVWVFINPELQCYFFKEGYLRLSGYNYQLTKESINNIFVHLTNNAIQKSSEAYNKHQQGNQLSFEQFQNYLRQNTTIKFQGIIKRIKELVKLTLEATLPLINQKLRKGCFQLLGYDFLVEEKGHVWLLQCNTNPCLEESSDLLSRLLPLLIKECLRILKKQYTKIAYFQKLL